MRFINFEYDGISLDSMGLRIVTFDGALDGDITTDSQRTFNSIPLFGGRYQPFITSVYEDRLEVDFSIGKQYCTALDSPYFTVQEIESIQYWLNRPTSRIFRILNEPEYNNMYWEGSFNIQWVKAGEKTIGLNVTFISTRPYAMGDNITVSKILGGNEKLVIKDTSTDEGSIVPDVTIEILSSGNLILTNTFNSKNVVTRINNCKNGEIIKFDKMLQLTTTDTTHKIYEDFNWVFPRLYNVYGNNTNTFKSNINCSCEISYSPVRKVTFA